ncbi:hypothetical protein SeLEV6574_g07314 [Synchytrium endobioticum]|uniref:Potassium channel tetramerisation-type BTB domain-containing protein n=1 Tax=Synchytrium endobioticum TaxID=286115 RepID=A0A507CIF2_9FUNG|nr:hypothetical protein SeLEV6574_g07314 [Synchytrium endobioticum]
MSSHVWLSTAPLSGVQCGSSGDARATTTFNVCGIRYEVLNSLVQRFPTSKLAQMACSAKGNEVYLDMNPYAFHVILDYLRYGRLHCPRNVAKEVVLLQLRALDIDIKAQLSEIDADSLPSNSSPLPTNNSNSTPPKTVGGLQPPPYSSLPGTYSSWNADVKSRVDAVGCVDSTPTLSHFPADHISSQVQISSSRKLENLLGGWLAPKILSVAQRGLRKVKFLFIPNGVEVSKIVGFESLSPDNTRIEVVHMPKTHAEDVNTVGDMEWLTAGTSEELCRMLVARTGIVRADTEKPEVFTRTESEWGILTSVRHPSLLLTATLT